MATSTVRITNMSTGHWCWTETDAERPGLSISTGLPVRTREEALADAMARFPNRETHHIVADGTSIGAALPPLPVVDAEAERRAAGVPGEMR